LIGVDGDVLGAGEHQDLLALGRIARTIAGKTGGVFADFDEAIRLEPKLAGAYYARGVSYAKKGNRTRALEDYRRALELDPNHSDARRELQSSTAR